MHVNGTFFKLAVPSVSPSTPFVNSYMHVLASLFYAIYVLLFISLVLLMCLRYLCFCALPVVASCNITDGFWSVALERY